MSVAILVGIFTGSAVSIGVALWLTLRNEKNKSIYIDDSRKNYQRRINEKTIIYFFKNFTYNPNSIGFKSHSNEYIFRGDKIRLYVSTISILLDIVLSNQNFREDCIWEVS